MKFFRDTTGQAFAFEADGSQDHLIPAGAVAMTAADVAALNSSVPNNWAARQFAARAALTESDLTVLRCYESAVAVPATWATYRKALRAIIAASTGDPTQAMPTKPAYPAGT
ncbi:MAG: hypothetical protein KGH75_06465 [Rhodospirillales bacterium]|nr:hypothetical protein [Rhodospirillales bacterium]